jgi:plastocyanin
MKISSVWKQLSNFSAMNLFSLILVAHAAVALCCHGGTITGVVRAEGKDAPLDGAGGKYDSRKFKFAERVNYADLRDFVVYIDHATPVKPMKPVIRTISQKGATFTPRVMPILAGTTIEWPNQDDIYHNVFSISETKPFDLELYKSPEVKRVPFDKPGRVDVFCSIHTTMSCIILVLENPWFAVSDAKGGYTITNVPPGAYTLKAWHERLPTASKQIVIPEDRDVKVNFSLGINNLPKY